MWRPGISLFYGDGLMFCLFLASLFGHISAYCLYGDTEDCAFQCHCAVASECGNVTSTCPSGCATAPLGYNWMGPGCQIGNVGLKKTAEQTGTWHIFVAGDALDGELGGTNGNWNRNCAHPAANKSQAAGWWTDLGALYKIFNITIYGLNGGKYQYRLQQFDLTVYNTTADEVLCAHQNDTIIYTSKTFECETPIVGRYVRFNRTGGPELRYVSLCEVVIIGHLYIECSKCPSNVNCDEIIGCEACAASYQPDCVTECDPGTYGTNCAQSCGQCKDGTNCSVQNGVCPEGCKTWYAGNNCDAFIDVPNHNNESSTIQGKSSDNIIVRWQHLQDVPSSLESFYYYSVQLKRDEPIAFYAADIDLEGYRKVAVVSYTDEPSWNIVALDFNTNYIVKIIPFREFAGTKDFGTPYPLVHVKTNCADPDKPRILNVTKLENANGSFFEVLFEAPDTVKPNCRNISNASLHYKIANKNFVVEHLHIYDVNITIVLSEIGTYQFKIIVENNEGYQSSSDIIVYSPYGSGHENHRFPVAIVAGSVAAVLVIIVVIIVTVLLLRRRRNNKSNNERTDEFDNIEQTINQVHDKETAAFPLSTIKTDEINSNTIMNPEVVKSNPEVATDSNVLEVQDENLYANSTGIVPVDEFERYVVRRKANMKELYDEYMSLPQDDLSRCNDARTETNKLKNRYKNIFAYDETRVPLDGDGGKEYINANYITGYNKAKEYIATQGTKKGTLIAFWRMMWQEKINRIVMVANVEEKGKRRIDPYWPENTGETVVIGYFTITTESLEMTADYTTRIMSISKQNETRTVHQFHFTTWEDKNKPVYGPMSLLSFCNKVHSFDKFKQGPLVVHCSAGVGRTGTFIALDILQQMATTDKSLDIYNCVKRLRHERMTMVQTKEQYVFLHDVLVEFIKCNAKAYECQEFLIKFDTIRNPEPAPRLMLEIEKEFELIVDMKMSHENSTRGGMQTGNVDKNMNNNVLSGEEKQNNIISEDTRKLLTSGKQNNINVVYVDSFKAHDTYVVTKTPLPDTIADFWQLVIEQKCQAIVMLNQVNNGDGTSPYWPDEEGQPQIYRHVQVELLSIDNNSIKDAIIIRDFKVTPIPRTKFSDPVVLKVRHFQLLSWPQSNDLPENRGHILDLMDLLQSWQQQHKRSADKWKTLVHCLDGGSHSGMFCGASYVLDRMKVEQDVDAVLAVRYVTRGRPEFFTKLIEYQFLYQMAVECMTKYNVLYANLQQ